jgi:subtilisin family serine protease
MPTPSTTANPSINYNDAEYKLSNVDVAANALSAYNAGATGAGIKIAILDSGLSDPGKQFTGRIDSASTDNVSNRGYVDVDGHGTSVASIAAAGRDGNDMMGVAFNATVLVARTDTVGSCGSSTG